MRVRNERKRLCIAFVVSRYIPLGPVLGGFELR
jgi:hypothetical protein